MQSKSFCNIKIIKSHDGHKLILITDRYPDRMLTDKIAFGFMHHFLIHLRMAFAGFGPENSFKPK